MLIITANGKENKIAKIESTTNVAVVPRVKQMWSSRIPCKSEKDPAQIIVLSFAFFVHHSI
jgi:hypothetical protein